MKGMIAIVVACALLSGCAVTYTYEGKKYKSKEEFQNAVDSSVSYILSSVSPLAKPVTSKKLIFAIPAESTLNAANVSNFVARQGTQPVGPAREIIDNLTRSTYKNIRVFYDAIERRKIFGSVQFVDMQSMIATFPASPDVDALYYVEPSLGSGQWFYTSAKHGRQIFAYDRSAPDGQGKVKAFLDAVQAQAARD